MQFLNDSRPKILIVDDEPFNVDYLEQELEDLDYDTVSASNGQEALLIVSTESPDVVLLDVNMPIMDGFQTLTILKSDAQTRDIPVIIISAAHDLDNVVKGIEMGAEDYLPKPFDPILLRARIAASLEKKQWHDLERIYREQIESEKKRADELLQVILPEPIIDELKATNQFKPRHFDNVAIMFTDVVGFTPYSESHSPRHVVENLQHMIAAYENVTLRYQMQKIKTNGDAFMVVAGLFEPLETPVFNCVQAGWEMLEIAQALPDPWQVRIGVHTGPVIGAILGHRQYLFDVWGDAVNTAQRVESHGAINAVTLSKLAWEQVKHLCQGKSLGLIDVKGKGQMELFRTNPLGSI